MSWPRVSALRTAEQFSSRLQQLGIDLPFDEELQSGPASVLAQPLNSVCGRIGNRWCILPMEGWDGTLDGRPSELTRRRWTRFGLSGAKLMWGCEAVAVRFDGRANPNQLVICEENLAELAALRHLLVDTHATAFGDTSDLLIGLQLTHSGRFARPLQGQPIQPAIAYRHPVLDARFGVTSDSCLLSDDDLRRLIDDFIRAAVQAQRAGFTWVDIKHCHGYLGHEILSGFDRPGDFGGSFENRTRFLREITSGIRSAAPGLGVGVRLSVFDFVPFQPGKDADRTGVPSWQGPYPHAFGGDGSGHGMDPA
jgi:2,4-dienoyl-CoA reductase-like NADH-dependent reductase (Old Yellow Enzyme family)